MSKPKKYPPEFREQAARTLLEQQDLYDSQWVAMNSIAVKVGSRGDSYDNALAETINGLYKLRSFTHAAPGGR